MQRAKNAKWYLKLKNHFLSIHRDFVSYAGVSRNEFVRDLNNWLDEDFDEPFDDDLEPFDDDLEEFILLSEEVDVLFPYVILEELPRRDRDFDHDFPFESFRFLF